MQELLQRLTALEAELASIRSAVEEALDPEPDMVEPEYLTVREIARLMKVPATEVTRRLVGAGLMEYAYGSKYHPTVKGRPYMYRDSRRNLTPRWSREVVTILDSAR